MGKPNYRQIYAKQHRHEQMIVKVCPGIPDRSGIYFLTRKDEDGICYFYIGQAVSLIKRMCSHMTGYQHIDLSLKKRGFCSEDNPYGWKLNYIEYPKDKLDEMEQYWILEYTKKGYQCRYNKTGGGQGEGKEKINEFRPAKGYRDGIKQGEKNLAKEIRTLLDKHLKVETKDNPPNRYQQQALEKFQNLIYGDDEDDGADG